MSTEIDEIEEEFEELTRNNEQQITDFESGMRDRNDQEFIKFKQKVMGRLKNLEQKVGDYNLEDLDYDLTQPYERDISAETRPQLSNSSIDKNKQLTHLSNHELHQVKNMHEKNHRKKIRTILDEPLGDILDNTINFLAKSMDSLESKRYEAELMENIHSGDKIGLYTKIKLNIITFILFFREDRNIIYIGFILIFLSIIIYFTNIITTA